MCTNIPEPCPSHQPLFFFFHTLLGQEKPLQSQSAYSSLLAGYQMIYFLRLWSKEEKIRKAKKIKKAIMLDTAKPGQVTPI